MNQVSLGQPAPILSDRMLPVRRFLRSPGGLLLLLVLATRVRGGEVDSATALAALGAFTALWMERGSARAAVILATLAPLFVAVAATSAGLADGGLDSRLAEVDRALLGEPAAAWFAGVAPWPLLREALALGYLSYYLMIPAAWLAAARRSPELAETALHTIVLTFCLVTLAELLLPTVGPLAARATVAGSWPLERTVDLVYRLDPGGGAAFPSSHIAVGGVAAWILWETLPPARAVVALLFAAMVVCTVQGSFHYLLDVPGGLLVAAVGVHLYRRRVASAALAPSLPPRSASDPVRDWRF